MNQSSTQLIAIRNSVALVGRLSDSLIRVGPFSLGLDGIIAWIPGVGELYSVAAGGFIVIQGLRAGVPVTTLAGTMALMGVRTVAGAIPLAGAAFADVFTAHKWAAAMIVNAIDQKLLEVPISGNWSLATVWRRRVVPA